MKLFARALGTCALTFAIVVPVPAAEPITIGLVDEVTGPQAEAGVLTMRGVKLAIEEINAAKRCSWAAAGAAGGR